MASDSEDRGDWWRRTDKASAYTAYSLAEEIWHIATHGVGFIAAILAWIFMAIRAAPLDAAAIASAHAFGAGMFLMYGFSTTFHSTYAVQHRPVWRLLDHMGIYIMIGASYTPFALMTLPARTATWFLALIWAFTLFGLIIKGLVFGLRKEKQFEWVSLSLYLIMGWLVMLVKDIMLQSMSWAAFSWLLAGGLCYTVGAIFYAARPVRYGHTLWHLFVLAGSSCHFICVYVFLLK